MQTSQNVIYILIKLNSRFLSDYISFDYTSSLVNFSRLHYGLERFGKAVLFKTFKYPTSTMKKSYLSTKRKFHFLFCKTRKRQNRSLWRRAVLAVSEINDVDSPSHTGRNVRFVCRVKPSRAKPSRVTVIHADDTILDFSLALRHFVSHTRTCTPRRIVPRRAITLFPLGRRLSHLVGTITSGCRALHRTLASSNSSPPLPPSW